MTRLFLSVPIPEPVEDRLLEVQEGLPDARWTSPGDHHVTLVFLGDVPDHRRDALHQRLAAVRNAAFSLSIAGVGHFPPRGPVRSLWAGLTPSEPLHRLQHKLATVARDLDLPADLRKFAPHVTLARLRSSSRTDEARVVTWEAAWLDLATPAWQVTSFALMRSQPGPDGSDYALDAEFALE